MGRKISLAQWIKPDRLLAREIFIRSALVEGDFQTRAPFWRHNQEMIAAVHDLEAKSRRRDILVDEERIYGFYDQRIPEGICTTPAFEKWLKKQSKQESKLLYLSEADLIRKEASIVPDDQFPNHLDINGMALPLEYSFDPGQQQDGISLVVPKDVLGQVTEARCQWLVPGLLRERVIALIRGLPKSLRKSFVPVPDFADACLQGIEPSDRPLIQVLGERLKQLTGVHVPEDAWSDVELPEHLRMQIKVVDETGKQIGTGRNLDVLHKAHRTSHRGFQQLASSDLEQKGLTDWDFGPLQPSLSVKRGGITLKGFPALVDEGDSVAIRLLDSEASAYQSHKAGVRRLIKLKLAKEIRYLRKNLPNLARMRLQYAKVPKAPEGLPVEKQRDLEDELVTYILDRTFLDGLPEIRDKEIFLDRIERCRNAMMTVANDACQEVGKIIEEYQKVRKKLSGTTQINWMASAADMQQQLDRLVFKGFLAVTPPEQLGRFPRYLQALEKRLEKLQSTAARDQQQIREMAKAYRQWQQWDEQCRKNGRSDERIEEMRWHFEELRVSLFAQELGTAYPISLKRIEKRWKDLGL